jgi:hypothetical protein
MVIKSCPLLMKDTETCVGSSLASYFVLFSLISFETKKCDNRTVKRTNGQQKSYIPQSFFGGGIQILSKNYFRNFTFNSIKLLRRNCIGSEGSTRGHTDIYYYSLPNPKIEIKKTHKPQLV